MCVGMHVAVDNDREEALPGGPHPFGQLTPKTEEEEIAASNGRGMSSRKGHGLGNR